MPGGSVGGEAAGGIERPPAWGGQPCDDPAPQDLSITLADRNYTVSGANPDVRFRVKAGSLHLVLDVTVGSAYNLTLIWNKHMTVFIKMARASQVRAAPAGRPGCGAAPARLTLAPAGRPVRLVRQLQRQHEGRL